MAKQCSYKAAISVQDNGSDFTWILSLRDFADPLHGQIRVAGSAPSEFSARMAAGDELRAIKQACIRLEAAQGEGCEHCELEVQINGSLDPSEGDQAAGQPPNPLF